MVSAFDLVDVKDDIHLNMSTSGTRNYVSDHLEDLLPRYIDRDGEFSNDANSVYVYTRDSPGAGTIIGVSLVSLVHRENLVYVETRHAIFGIVLHSEVQFKKDVQKFFTSSWHPHPDFPHAHYDIDENTTTHYFRIE